MAAMIVIVLWLGLYPQPVLDAAGPALTQLREKTTLTPPPSPVRPELVRRLSGAAPPWQGADP
jgi:hypothetical protein